jgi:hypothetical protein
MIERRRGLGLLHEPPAALGVSHLVRREDLEEDRSKPDEAHCPERMGERLSPFLAEPDLAPTASGGHRPGRQIGCS